MTAGPTLTAAAALASGAVGGIFFTFSTFIMRGLTRLPDAQGVAAMQSINIAALRPPLMTALFGTAILSVVQAVRGFSSVNGNTRALLIAGATLYLLGTMGVTMARNVPLNSALAAAGDTATADLWRDYARRWTRWNHVRTVSSLAAGAAFLAAATSQD
jgi:uncharacterized membrane protein